MEDHENFSPVSSPKLERTPASIGTGYKLPPVSSPPKLERTSFIYTEPKTLLEEELESARQAALEILKNHTKEEAEKIFLQVVTKPEESSKEKPGERTASRALKLPD